MQMTIAAVIPLYNGGDFIEEAIHSVLEQTRPADEIIVVDDGSTDDGPSKIERLAAKHPITLLRKRNGGQSSARNVAIKHSQCEYIAFLDQDDVWYDDHLAILAQPFSDSQIKDLGLVYGNIDLVDRQGRMIVRCYLDEIDFNSSENFSSSMSLARSLHCAERSFGFQRRHLESWLF